MRIFDVLNDFIAGKKISNNDMTRNEDWLEYDDMEKCMRRKSTIYRYIPNIYYIKFTDLIRDDWYIIN